MYFVSGISLKVESFSGCHTKKELGPWGTDIVNRISSVLCFFSFFQMKVVYGHHYLDVNSLWKEPAWPFGSDWCGIMLQDSLIWANLLGFCSLYLYPLLWKNLKLLLSLNHVLQVLTNPIAFSMCGPGFCHAVKDTAKVVADRDGGNMRSLTRPAPSNLQKQASVACFQYGSGVKILIWAFSNRWPFSDRHCGVE